MSEKLEAAKNWMGTTWILHPNSTYDSSRRLVMGSVILMGLRAKAMAAGRLT